MLCNHHREQYCQQVPLLLVTWKSFSHKPKTHLPTGLGKGSPSEQIWTDLEGAGTGQGEWTPKWTGWSRSYPLGTLLWKEKTNNTENIIFSHYVVGGNNSRFSTPLGSTFQRTRHMQIWQVLDYKPYTLCLASSNVTWPYGFFHFFHLDVCLGNIMCNGLVCTEDTQNRGKIESGSS